MSNDIMLLPVSKYLSRVIIEERRRWEPRCPAALKIPEEFNLVIRVRVQAIDPFSISRCPRRHRRRLDDVQTAYEAGYTFSATLHLPDFNATMYVIARRSSLFLKR